MLCCYLEMELYSVLWFMWARVVCKGTSQSFRVLT